MRTLTYFIEKANGAWCATASYAEAKANGNKILDIGLKEVDETTPEQLEEFRKHREKLAEKRKQK